MRVLNLFGDTGAATRVTDLDHNATITITSITQDEPTNGLGDGDTAVDRVKTATARSSLRAERSGTADGRVYGGMTRTATLRSAPPHAVIHDDEFGF